MRIFRVMAFVACGFLAACGGDSKGGGENSGTNTGTSGTTNGAVSYGAVADLSQALGAPLKIKAPSGFSIVSSAGLIQEATVQATDYYIQIMATDALTTDRKALKTEALAEVKAMKEFSAIVQEEEFGFVYETTWEGNAKGYNFRYFVLMGGKVFDFRSSSVNNFSKEQVVGMYAAVKQE